MQYKINQLWSTNNIIIRTIHKIVVAIIMKTTLSVLAMRIMRS